MLHSGRLRPYPKALNQAGKACQRLTLAYYENPQITAIISFIVQAPAGYLLIWQTCNNKEHLLQHYLPLSHFDHSVIKLKITIFAPNSFFIFQGPLTGSSYSLMSTPKCHLATNYICMCYKYLEYKKPSFEFGILDPRQLYWLSQLVEIDHLRARSLHVHQSFFTHAYAQ